MAQQEWNSALYDQKHSFVYEYGQDLLSLLQPQPAELILDLGCGTGHLTAQIAQSGARVIGLDHSAQMLETARQQYPQLEFVQGDASAFSLPEACDAVFSNAVLHWVTRAAEAAACIAQALKPGGRFVAEFGGQGNVANIVEAVQAVMTSHTQAEVRHPWYYPSIGAYATLLEAQGLEVRQAFLFDRFTKLEGADGMRNWLTMFAESMFADLPVEAKETALTEIEARLRPTNFRAGVWYADYRRLRVVAVRVK
ncbi:MAG: methyltransferase domain-containing protein [Acidobacteria bacterium]|nr:methyltransferase domain-containing protein [Acidobacteriota bacterium]MBI3427355.1 methyltransferase domain-containing protein [Acidobacteriota bacterium]